MVFYVRQVHVASIIELHGVGVYDTGQVLYLSLLCKCDVEFSIIVLRVPFSSSHWLQCLPLSWRGWWQEGLPAGKWKEGAFSPHVGRSVCVCVQ